MALSTCGAGHSGALDSAAPRTAAVAQRQRPTGRYVYESSSDEEPSSSAPVPWRSASRRRLRWDTSEQDLTSDSESDNTLPPDLGAIRLANELDPWDRWEQDCRRRAWRPAAKQNSSVRRSMTPGRELTPAVDSDMHEIANMLSHFQMQHKETEQKERAAFERRNADLWEGIEKAVRDAETRAEHEAEQLAAARKRQEQAKADAKKARELEMARIAEEKKAAEERKAAEAAAQRARAEQDKAEEVFNTMRGGEHVWPQAAREYAHWQERMRYVKQDILPQVKANADWRKQCFAAKRAITPKIGQLTNERQQIQRVTTEVAAILTQARSVPDKHASTVLYYWMLNHLAKSLIRQAEQEVAARQETAFPLARTALGLMLLGHDTLGEVLMARLVKKCPFVLAYVPERKAGVDEAAYRKTLGLKVDGEETVHMYATRMTGIAALYFACLQSSLVSVAETISVGANLPALAKHLCAPFRPDRLWTWSVRCTTPPITQQPLLPALWSTFLEVAGPAYLQRFGTQARKLLAMLFHAGIQQQKLAPVTEKEEVSQRNAIKAASVRLRLILESWEQRGNLDEYASGGLCMDS